MPIAQPTDPSRCDDAIIIALGSNLPGEYASVVELLDVALIALPKVGLQVLERSEWWRSDAWPNPADPPFINGVAVVATTLGAASVLEALHNVEARFGRRRPERNAPRTLDLDLIAYGRLRCDSPALPHPRAHERAFVMRPLAQIAPDWRHPVTGKFARDLAASAPVGADACLLMEGPGI